MADKIVIVTKTMKDHLRALSLMEYCGLRKKHGDLSNGELRSRLQGGTWDYIAYSILDGTWGISSSHQLDATVVTLEDFEQDVLFRNEY